MTLGPAGRARPAGSPPTPGPQPVRHTLATRRGAVDVLVAHALFMALDPKQVAKQRPFPPLGTLYAAAHLRRHGHAVAVFDAMLAPGPEAIRRAFELHPPRVVAIVEDSFNFLSKMCLGQMRQAALAMVGAARGRGLPVVVAGSDASDAPGRYLDAGATAVIRGEAEHALLEAVAALLDRGTRGLDAVAGVVTRHAAGAAPAPVREPERRPDRFAWPARDLVDIDAYRRVWTAAHGSFALNMVATRGCPFHCNWCAKPIWGQRYAMRSAVDVADEMADVKRTLAPDRLWFADDIFGLRPEWVAELGAAIDARGARIPFQIQSRVDLVTDVAVEGLARAGCDEVWLGVESGSQRILDAMEKGIRAADVPAAVARLRQRGIRACFFLQLGYPGEAWDDIQATVDLVRATLPDDIGVSVSYPLPGTRFHTRVARELRAGGDRWTDSDDLAMLFHGTYTTDVYRALHRALHADLAAGRAEAARLAVARGLRTAATDAWRKVARLEASGRAARPTPAPAPAEPLPPPDLSRAAN